jgi:hypothetical protein
MPAKAIASQPHIHGEAELTIIIENEVVHIALVAPAQSLVGFEHRAKTDRELLILTNIKKALSSSESIIRLQGGHCLINETHIEVGNLTPHAHNTHHQDHNSSKENEQVNTHTEITAQYLFHCKEVNQLTSASIELFQNFTAIKHINTSWVTAKEQNSKKIHRANKHLQLR